MTANVAHPVLKMEHIIKRFGEVVANDDINFEVEVGEIHCLLGENGAGKTTLMNILYGLWQPDEGTLYIRGERARFKSPKDAISNKIGMVSQQFNLVPPLTVTENVVMEDIPSKNTLVDMKEAEERVNALAKRCGFRINAQSKVEDLSVGEQQRVEILKALYGGADILILDEPTAVLTSQETDELFKVLRFMSTHRHSVIFITHKLREAMLCDRITILMAGKVVAQKVAKETSKDEIVRAMFKERVLFHEDTFAIKPTEQKKIPVLEVTDLHAQDDRGLDVLKGISFHISDGSILGIAGIAGNGQRELIEVITGLRKAREGKILLRGRDITNSTPKLRRESGMAHIPEDQVRRGSFCDLDLSDNLILGREDKVPFVHDFMVKYFPILDHKQIQSFSKERTSSYDVRSKSINDLARHLSGGNLQKLILARELAGEPDPIIAAQPTRGLDAKAVEFVHQRLLEQRAKGKSVLLISYDLDEIMRLSDRIGVIYEGEIHLIPIAETKRSEIERMMVGGLREF
ncbi:ABC transporter ATP-binding protein [Chloroflexota bacterium]